VRAHVSGRAGAVNALFWPTAPPQSNSARSTEC